MEEKCIEWNGQRLGLLLRESFGGKCAPKNPFFAIKEDKRREISSIPRDIRIRLIRIELIFNWISGKLVSCELFFSWD